MKLIGGLIVFAILAYVGLSLAFELIPLMTNLTHSETGIVGSILDVSLWLLPVAIGVGLILAGVRYMRGKSRG